MIMAGTRTITLFALSLIIGGAGSVSASLASSHCAATTAEENVELVKTHIQAMVGKDTEAAGALLHEDLSHNLGRRGIEAGQVSADELAKRTPSDVSVHDVFGSGDKVAVRFSFPVEAGAVEGASGDSASETNAIAIVQIECGKIRQVWIEQDDLGLALAMGMTVQSAK